MNNEEKSFQKTNINWLACICDDNHLNSYKLGISKK